jgi:two-component system, LytTR family, sensor kinase
MSAAMPARLRTRLLILAFWTTLGLLESSKAYLAEQLRGPEGMPPGVAHGWAAALVGNMPWWLLWAVLTPLVFALARRFRLDGRRRWAAALAHLAAGLVVSLVHLGVIGVLYYYTITHGTRVAGPLVQVENILDAYLVVDIMTYFAVVGAWYALEFAERAREREVAALQLEAHAASLEAQMAEARLSALRMELNPHFLFNALNAISGLARRGDSSAAVEMLARLGDLLRLAFERHLAHEVPLAKELEFLDLYLAIERARFPDRLVVKLEVEPGARDALVPTFILQPIVENAIRHGIAPVAGPGLVRVAATLRDDALVLEVADTGPGFGRSVRREPGAGIGLANTRSRLEQLYGDAAELRLENAMDGGAVVTVVLPRRSSGARVSDHDGTTDEGTARGLSVA